MPKANKPTRRKLIKVLARGYSERSEEDREQAMREAGLTKVEKEQVRELWRREDKTPGLGPKELRQDQIFRSLVQDVRRGQCILFVGSGLSIDVGMPSASQLVDALFAKARSRGWIKPRDKPEDYTLQTISDLLVDKIGKEGLGQALKERFDAAMSKSKLKIQPYQRGAFRLIPTLSSLNARIITTNWDSLLEDALRDNNKLCNIVRRDQDIHPEVMGDHEVLKLHGDFTNFKSLVVTKTDYKKIEDALREQERFTIGSLWGIIATLFSRYRIIFVGFSLDDPHIHLIRELVKIRSEREGNSDYMVGPYSRDRWMSMLGTSQLNPIPATATNFFIAITQELCQFANRKQDLDRIFSRSSNNFMELYAHFGAGKTALLDEVQRQAMSRGWTEDQIVRVDLRRKTQSAPSYTRVTLLKKIAESIYTTRHIRNVNDLFDTLRDKNNVFVIIDSTEYLECAGEECRHLIARDLASALKKQIEDGHECRLILCGRFPLPWSFELKDRYYSLPLSPFDLKAVREMIDLYVTMADAKTVGRPSTQLAEQVFEITGRSHPGFVKDILSDLIPRSSNSSGDLVLPDELTSQECRAFLANFSHRIDAEVWNFRDPREKQMGDLFSSGLCVLRMVDSSLLKALAASSIFTNHFAGLKPQTVSELLQDCRLLTKKLLIMEMDPVIRRIKSSYLAFRNKTRLIQVHTVVAKAYYHLLSGQSDDVQFRYLCEWLFHRANQLRYQLDTEKERWLALQAEVQKVEYHRRNPGPNRMGKALVEHIVKREGGDTELFDELYACLGQGYYDKLCALLISRGERRI